MKDIIRNSFIKQHLLLQLLSKYRTNMGDFTFESTHIRADGTEFPVEINSHLIRTDNGSDLVLSIAGDITERKKNKTLPNRTKSAFDHSPDKILLQPWFLY